MKSIIYISYGIPKSASSFVYHMVDRAVSLYSKHHHLAKLNLIDLFPGCKDPHFTNRALEFLDLPSDAIGLENLVDLIELKLDRMGGGVIALKTHLPCSSGLAKKIEDKRIIASACFRHPAEMILSRLDMMRRQGEKEKSFYQVQKMYKVTHIPNFFSWANSTGVEKFYFDDVVSYETEIAKNILNQFQFEINYPNICSIMIKDKTLIWQFNKGVLNRHVTEMTFDQINELEKEFSGFMGYIEKHKSSKKEYRKLLFTAVIVTPTLNNVATIDETILSVISQRGDFRIRYHIQDGGSTDGTIDRIKEWERLLQNSGPFVGCSAIEFSYASSKDSGVYDALNKGFRGLSGDIYSWLGSDDLLANGCIQSIKSLLQEYPDIHWVTGATSTLREDGVIHAQSSVKLFPREALEIGLADSVTLPLIQQEGTFWTDWLWHKVGKNLRPDLSLAGDYELWIRMAEYSDIVSLVSPLGFFRYRRGQLSSNMVQYMNEVEIIREKFNQEKRMKVMRNISKGNMSARVASSAVRSNSWAVKDVCLPNKNLDWAPIVGIGDEEGPYPEFGLMKPFYWMTGPTSSINIFCIEPGLHKLRFRMRNYLRQQHVVIYGSDFKKRFKAPIFRRWRKSFFVDVIVDMPREGLLLTFEFSKTDKNEADPRERALILLELTSELIKKS